MATHDLESCAARVLARGAARSARARPAGPAGVALLLAVGLAAGCAGPSHQSNDPTVGVNPDGTPKWVRRGSGAYDGDGGKAFFGVGIVQGIQNVSLRRQTADNRARGEIAKLFDTYIAAMMRDYQRSTTASVGAGTASAEEQDVVSAQKTITEATLRGVEIRDHWEDPATGASYALAVLSLNAVRDSVNNNQQLPAAIRDHVRRNADKAFEDLDKALGKRDERASAPAETAAPASPPPAASSPPPAASSPPPAEPSPAPAAAKGKKKRVGLKITGNEAKKTQTCLAGKLIEAGYDVIETSSDVDYMVRGKIRFRRAGVVRGTVMVKALVELRVNDMANGKTLAALVESFKVGRPSMRQAVLTASTKTCKLKVPMFVSKIKKAIGN